MENRLTGQGEGEQPPALGVPITCEWRCSGLEGRFPQEPLGSSSCGQSSTLSFFPGLKGALFPPGETLVLQEVPGQGAGRVPQVLSLWTLEKLTLTPIKAASLQGRVEGNLPAQGESKGARTAGQSAFPSWGSQHLSPGLLQSPPNCSCSPCSHLPSADSLHFHQNVISKMQF